MLRKLVFILIILINSIDLKAQDSLSNSLEITFGINRLDFFTGVNYTKQFDQLSVFSTFEFGVNRTFFQYRPFPRVSFGSSYTLFNGNKVSIGPQISWSYSFLKVNKNTTHFSYWNELYLGSKLQIGNRIRFTNVISGGWMNERYFSQLTNKMEGVNSMGFYINTGLSYVF